MAASAIINEDPPDLIKKLLKSFGLQEKEDLFLNFLCDEAINLHYVYEFRYVLDLNSSLENLQDHTSQIRGLRSIKSSRDVT